jgi:hypothetical protein
MTKKKTEKKPELTFEQKKAKVARFNVMDDVFFQKMVEDSDVLEEILQIILEDKHLKVIKSSVKPQESLKNLQGKSVILDVLCKLSDDRYINTEVQKSDDTNHAKRVRYNASLLTANTTEIGEDYLFVPDVVVVFISNFDIFEKGRTIYHAKNTIIETGEFVENGLSEVYVNTKVDDGTEIAQLMQYFKKSVGYNPICPKLSNRVKLFKEYEEGVDSMCTIMEEERLAGREEGRREGIINAIALCKDFGADKSETSNKIAKQFSLSIKSATRLVEENW